MNPASIILLVLVIGLCLFLVIDTTIYCVKRIKAKIKAKKEKQSGVAVDDNANND